MSNLSLVVPRARGLYHSDVRQEQRQQVGGEEAEHVHRQAEVAALKRPRQSPGGVVRQVDGVLDGDLDRLERPEHDQRLVVGTTEAHLPVHPPVPAPHGAVAGGHQLVVGLPDAREEHLAVGQFPRDL